METNDSQAIFSTARPISQLFGSVLSDILQKMEEHYQQIKLLLDRSTREVVQPQAAENIDDANVHPKGHSTSVEDPENKEPKNSSDSFDEPRNVTGLQRARQGNETTGSGLRNAPTEKSLTKVKKKEKIFLGIALAMIILLPGTEGRDEQVLHVKINESVTLSADTKKGDFVEWLRNPASDPSDYFTLYRAGEGFKDDGCGGYRSGEDNSIVIDKVQPCHLGTYTAEYSDGETWIIVLIMNDTANTTIPTESTNAPDTKTQSSSITSSSPDEKSQALDNTVIAAIVCVSTFVAALVILIVVLTWKRKTICNNSPAGQTKGNANYEVVSPTEV